MRRIVAVLMLTAMLLTALPLLVSAKQKDLWVDMDYEELWERKNEKEGAIVDEGVSEEVISSCPFVGSGLTVLFYTDAFDDLTFERLVAEDYENGVPWETPGDRQVCYLPTVGYPYQYIYSEELDRILEERCVYSRVCKDREYTWIEYDQHLPYLRGCIEEFGITKEELRAACVLSRENPDYIREKLSMFTDEEFERMKARGELTCNYDQSYLLDALYLPDENKVRELCLLPYGVAVDGKVFEMWRLKYAYEEYEGEPLIQWMLTKKINTPGMKRMIKNAYDSGTGGSASVFAKNIAALEARVAELDAMEEQAPKAGDRTVLYLLISAAGFAGGVVLLHEMKKRKN